MTDAQTLLATACRDLARLPPVLDALLGDLDPETWRERPAPAEWSPVEIICHLRDEETEDFGARLRVIAERGSAFTPIDPAGWAEARRYRDADPATALLTLLERRAETLVFVGSLAPERLQHAVSHARLGTLSGLDLLAAWVTHDRLHLTQLAATLARLGARRWAPLRTEYAGPIPYAESPVQ
jgi:DinB superfamily